MPTTSSGKLKAEIELLAPDHSTRRVHESLAARIVFFLHIATGPDNTDNVMALAFGLPHADAGLSHASSH